MKWILYLFLLLFCVACTMSSPITSKQVEKETEEAKVSPPSIIKPVPADVRPADIITIPRTNR